MFVHIASLCLTSLLQVALVNVHVQRMRTNQRALLTPDCSPRGRYRRTVFGFCANIVGSSCRKLFCNVRNHISEPPTESRSTSSRHCMLNFFDSRAIPITHHMHFVGR